VLSLLGKKALCEKDRKFISKVNSKWWPELVEKATEYIGKKDGDFVVLWSEDLREHFMMYNSMNKRGKIKRKCVLTNSFLISKLPRVLVCFDSNLF
jgi:hypothetical protein